MINIISDHFSALYAKNIISELFPECCFSWDKNIECQMFISNTPTTVRAKIVIDDTVNECTEEFSVHINDRLATTTAIGKAIIKYAKTKNVDVPPYGVLTGVRPFKIAIDLLSRYDYDNVIYKLKNTYLVSEDKIELLLSAAMYDQKLRENHTSKDASVYISIPFCPSRCNYCSFISSSAPSKLGLIDLYVDELIFEIERISELIYNNSLNLKSIYIGGGTPTVLSEEQLKRLLSEIDQKLPKNHLIEYTLEAGRPDTINKNKLDVMKSFGITRTCINCQSTDDNVLKAIGRNHTADEFFKAFELAQSYGFDCINTDVIAGLNTDTLTSFKKTIDDVIALSPESITVHTLCVKKSSTIKLEEMMQLEKNVDDYLSWAKSMCILNAYLPYYLYKQKYSVGNHENVGYCKHGKECYYNIAMMNEIEHVFGIGAGASSKLVGCNDNGKIEHFYNFKYPTEYIGNKQKIYNKIEEINTVLRNQ